VSRLLAGYNRKNSLIPGRGKRLLSLLHSSNSGFRAYSVSHFKGYWRFAIKQIRHEANRSPHLVARLRMSAATLSTHHMPLWHAQGQL